MKLIIITIIIILIITIFYCLKCNTEHFSYYLDAPRKSLLGPAINSIRTSNFGDQKEIYTIEPSNMIFNNGKLILSSYDNDMNGNFTENNIEKSLTYAMFKEILSDVKLSLNHKNRYIHFNINNVREVDNNNQYLPIFEAIFDSINEQGNNVIMIQPSKLINISIYKDDSNNYLIDSLIAIDIQQDKSIFKLYLIIKFTISHNNLSLECIENSKCIKKNTDIFINELSVIKKI